MSQCNIKVEGYDNESLSVPLRKQTALVQFKRNWHKIVWGCLKYVISHPLIGPKILRCRFDYIRKNFNSIKTPEGFTIKYNHQLLVYFQLFVIQDLYNKYLIRELKKTPNPFVIDVGSNVGMFAQWIVTKNSSAYFSSFEPYKPYIEEASRIRSENWISNIQYNAVVGADRGMSWINEQQVNRVALDDYISYSTKIFLIKIDTDGMNAQVLKGARKTLEVTRFVLIEKESNYNVFFLGWKCIDLGNDLLYENPKWKL